MLIKYNGLKESKRLEWPHKDWGLREYVWDEINGKTCEVTDAAFARFLLHPDKKGLFSLVKEAPVLEQEAPKVETKPKRRRRKKVDENVSSDS